MNKFIYIFLIIVIIIVMIIIIPTSNKNNELNNTDNVLEQIEEGENNSIVESYESEISFDEVTGHNVITETGEIVD